jgi:hypothetical protein
VTWPGVAADAAAAAVRAFLAQPQFEIQRLTSKGTKTVDVRAGIVSLTAPGTDPRQQAGTDPSAGCAILRMIVRQMTPAVRPDDILAALRQLSALEPGSPAIATRLWQGPMSELSAAQTGDQTGMITDRDAAEASRRKASTRAADPSQQVFTEASAVRGVPGSSPDEFIDGRMTDKAMRLEAESAVTAPASQARANDQLPRGARDHVADSRAREPYGRDCPDARNGATEQQRVRAE